MADAVTSAASTGAAQVAAADATARNFSQLERPLPVRGTHWASTAWWGMAFLILTEGSLFAYLLFSYFYLASQSTGSWPTSGPPELIKASIGTVLLLWNLMGRFSKGWHLEVSVGIVYWHFVDVVWLAVY